LALLSNHYRVDWFWNDEVFAEAKKRLARWREALGHAPMGSAAPLVEQLRAALAEDLNAPAALAAVDAWAEHALGDRSEADAALIRAAIDALLGVVL
jgi:L-cysteine:1D-myo-inositol 2-amino-2-deoxy-alpha-D-glucopyranoside ligase